MLQKLGKTLMKLWKTEYLRKEIEDIKKKQMGILELKNIAIALAGVRMLAPHWGLRFDCWLRAPTELQVWTQGMQEITNWCLSHIKVSPRPRLVWLNG